MGRLPSNSAAGEDTSRNVSAPVVIPTLSYQEGRLRMDEFSRRAGLPSQRTIFQAYQVTGQVDVTALTAAVQTVVGRHAALRTTFPQGPTDQHVRPEAAVVVERLDVTAAGDPLAAARASARTFASRPFGADETPRIRTAVVELGAGDRLVVFTFDHLVVDAWSRTLVLEEINTCYRSAIAGVAPDLAAVEYAYEDYVRDQRAALTGPDHRRLLDYWTTALRGVGAIPALSTGVARSPEGSPVGCGTAAVQVPTDTSRELRAFAARQRCTVFIVVLAALQVALRLRGGSSDQAAAVNLYSRDTVGTERLVAPLAELMIVRSDTGSATTFADVLRIVRADTLDAQEHAGIPYPELVRAFNPEQYARPDAPVGIVLNLLYDELLGGVFEVPGARWAPIDLNTAPARPRSELMVVGRSGRDTLELSARFQTDRVDARSVRTLLGVMARVMVAAVANPDVRLDELAGTLGDASEPAG